MKTEKKRTLKGSVLFTVVSVLALMIIFMTSALALASAANRRAHKSYSASQASYTARAAIDSILAAVGTDNEFANAVAGITEGGSISVDVGINEPSLGKITNAKISYDGTVYIFDPVKMQWAEKNRLLISADVTLGGETQSITSHVIQDPVVKSDDGPGYLTMGGTSPNGNGGTVLGGSYIGMGIGVPYDKTDLTKGNKSWNDGITYFKYKEGDPYPTILEDHEYRTGITYTPKDQNKQEAPIVINGNYKIMTEMALYYTQKAKGAAIWGDVTFPNNGRFYTEFSDGLKKVANGGLKFTEIPFLYVDGDFQLSSSDDCIIGSKDGSIPFNLFAGTIHTKQNSNAIINSSVYLMDRGGESELQMGKSTFGTWVNSVYTGSAAYNKTAGFYSRGSIKFTGDGPLVVNGCIRVEENLTINPQMTVNGNIAVGGTLDFKTNQFKLGGGYTIYARNVTGTGVTVNNAGGLNPGYTQGNLNYVLGKDVSYVNIDNEMDHADYAWLLPEVLDAHTGTPVAGGNAIDFGGEVLTEFFDENSFDGTPTDDAGTNITKVYKANVYLKNGKEVPASEALNSAKSWTYKGESGTITIKPIEDFYKDIKEPIYPENATRETLMGVSGPVKGTEGHIAKQAAPTEVNNKVYTSASLVGNVTESCTLTGPWAKTVTVRTTGKDIHVLLDDVTFDNPETPGAARIYVDESAGGHVYFYFAGKVVSTYSNPAEVEKTKLFDTVKDLMTKWGIEDNIDKPSPEIPASSTLTIGMNGSYNKEKGDGFTASGNEINITGSTKIECGAGECWLSGTTVHIYPKSSGTTWVHLKGVKARNNCKFIIHDLDPSNGKQLGGVINFYIEGENNLDNTPIYTESFDKAAKSGKTYQIVSDPSNKALYTDKVPEENTIPAPNVNLYSKIDDPTATIKAQNGFFITAYIRAPYMTCDVSNFGGFYDDFMLNRLYYDGVKLGTMNTNPGNGGGKKCERLGIVGCFNVYDYPSQNDWTLLYIKQDGSNGGSSVKSADGAHTYAVVDYLDY